MREFCLETRARTAMIDITARVQQEIDAVGLRSGICTVFVPHTTAAVTVNENADPDVVRDMLMETAKMVPERDGYHHAEGNSDAHIKSSLCGCSCTIPVEEGRLCLGTWQSIYFCEFDGSRTRRVWVQVLGA